MNKLYLDIDKMIEEDEGLGEIIVEGKKYQLKTPSIREVLRLEMMLEKFNGDLIDVENEEIVMEFLNIMVGKDLSDKLLNLPFHVSVKVFENLMSSFLGSSTEEENEEDKKEELKKVGVDIDKNTIDIGSGEVVKIPRDEE